LSPTLPEAKAGGWFMPVILATWEAEIRRMRVQAQSRQIVLKNSKVTRAKWTRGVVQAVECLFCKQEALSASQKEYLQIPVCPKKPGVVV
jgi:hypothetical protein